MITSKTFWEVEGKQEDEDRKIQKLEEHRDMKKMVLEIGKAEGIDIQSTYGDDPNGDFVFAEEDKEKLEYALDKYLYDYKVRK
ncbi:hypothetical protein [Selenomonas ruminantium]|uniref:Uncharacterized protein n=1 Tax=Selenomonas ruminantium TaxID=971 RepID=A0A1I0YJU5_SELRU|nr:hypothetical protein [Selenomonas ruminantium]SFB13695.1 hypothetical protein SAMN05216587_11511 [Selenomonas ruminantium]